MQRDDRLGWEDEDTYWRQSYRTRPYATSSEREYDFYRPGYRYGYEAAHKYEGRNWNEIESDLSRSWNTYEHRENSTWEDIKDAVRDAWDRVTGKRTVGTR